MINLLHNAKRSLKKADRKDKTIRVVTQAAGENRVQIEVIDNGVGLEAEALSRIFTFEMSDSVEGQDLDLHASANAAISIGGSLMAVSDGPGKGSSFVLKLPMEEMKKTSFVTMAFIPRSTVPVLIDNYNSERTQVIVEVE